MIKLYQDYTDFKWEEESNEVIEELGLDPIPVGSLDLRDGREVRITEEDGEENEESGYMIVVFDGLVIAEYNICDTKEEVNKYLIKLQKQKLH